MAEVIRSSKASVESTLSHAVKTFNAKMKTLYKKKSKPLADQTSGIPPSQAGETLTAKKTETIRGEKSTTQGYSVAEAAANAFDMSKVLTYEDLQLLSNNFSPDNYMGRTHFGHLYKGIIPQGWKGMRSGEVTIKTWVNEQFVDVDFIRPHSPRLIRHSMEQEIKLLQQPDIAMHPCTVNVMGYCLDDNKLGVVFDLKPLHTLKKYIDNFAENFGWLERVNVAVKLAYVLKLFHEHVPEYTVRNLSPAHVMLDQDLNPVLIDHAMIHGGSFVDLLRRQYGGPYGVHGYVCANELMIGDPTKRSDIHAYGVILLEMIRQCTYRNNRESKLKETWTDDFAWRDYVHYKEKQEEKSDGGGAAEEDSLYSFAHKSLRNDPDYDAVDGNKISILALRCVEKLPPHVGSMSQVLKELKELKVVQSRPGLLLDDMD